jgi:hypothetical protein
MALNGTMVKIETVTVGSGGAASIEFTNIPQTYTDLMILYSSRSAGNVTGSWSCKWSFNGATTSYTTRGLFGDGSAASSSTTSDTYGGYHNNSTSTASTFGNGSIYIPNYTSSNNKSYSIDAVAENNATAGYASLLAGLRSNTAAITSVKLEDYNGNNLAQYSSATLYGISKVPSIAKAYGGDITTDSNYVYHTFIASGTFTPTTALTADILVIAGGGGGSTVVAGGGAGGVVYNAGTSLASSTNYTVTVGAGGNGGAAVSSGSNPGTQGGNSNVTGGSLSLTAAVGGGFGNPVGASTGGGTGGSGGANGGSPTAGQGFAGGTDAFLFRAGAGGGGAGGAGGNTTSGVGSGVGGVGTSTYSSFGLATGTGQIVSGTAFFAGGGGGGGDSTTGSFGVGGNGGGGRGGMTIPEPAGNGMAKTGGGGGGGSQDTGQSQRGPGGNGGSGVVIIRYAR